MSPVTIEKRIYYSVTEIARELGISRQTLWRWRSENKVPQGRRWRNGWVVFSEAESNEIKSFANGFPEDEADQNQLKIFGRAELERNLSGQQRDDSPAT